MIFFFLHSKCKSCNTVYYIDLTLFFVVIIHVKKELVFYCWKFNDIFDSDDVGTVM